MNTHFWQAFDMLVESSEIIIDRPKGTLLYQRDREAHYPLDYGYLAGTTAGDGAGIDVWVGTLPEKLLTGAIVTVDLQKRDSEVKLLIGCTSEERQTIFKIHDQSDWGGKQSAILLER